MIQKIHRQPSRCTMMPPKRGPSVGPNRGPSRYQPNTPALSLGTNMSLIVPPPFAIPTLPKKPAMLRTVMRKAMFGASAAGIWRSVKTEKQVKYMTLRPNVSESGARSSGPTPSITTNPVVVPMTAVVEHFKSSAISSMPGVNIELTSGLRTVATHVRRCMSTTQ
jgi:hypothetical protein